MYDHHHSPATYEHIKSVLNICDLWYFHYGLLPVGSIHILGSYVPGTTGIS